MCVFTRAFVHCWPLHGLIRRFRDVFVVFLFWSPAGTMLCSVLTCQSRCGRACMIQGWCVHAGQPNLMKPNAKKKKRTKSCRSVDNESEDDVLIFAAALRVWATELKWGGEEMGVRESSVSHFCPLSCSSNFTPSTPPPPPPPHLTPSGSQFSPGGSGAASSLSGGQEAQGPLHRQQVRSRSQRSCAQIWYTSYCCCYMYYCYTTSTTFIKKQTINNKTSLQSC